MRKTTPWGVCALILMWHATTLAQDGAEERARRTLAEAQAHEDEGRYALAAERYLELYEVMHGAGLERAPVALWSAGNAWSQVPGRERDAIDALRRFLEASSALAGDAQVRDWRSTAVSQIAELEARAPSAPASALAPPDPTPTPEGGSGISPVGPVIMGTGGVALLAGVVVGAISLVQASDFRGACDDLSMCPTALRPGYDEMRAFSAAADVLFVVGGLTAILGLVLTLTITEGSEGEASVSASCAPQGCGAVMRGSF